MASAREIERAIRKELGEELDRLTKVKLAIVLDTLGKLAEPLTEHSEDTGRSHKTGRGKRFGSASNKRGGGIGSPIYTGQYALNHMISVNGEEREPILFDRHGEAERVADPVNLSPTDLMEREAGRIHNLQFTDDISIVNNTPYADEIETHGTPNVPEGNFYGRALDYMTARLDRDLNGAATTSIKPTVG